EIGNETEPAIACVESIPDWLDRIVWNGKTLDKNITDSKFRTSTKDSPVFVLAQPEATNGLGRLCVAINWNGKFPAKHFQPATVIAMLVCKKQTVELLGGDATLLKADDDLARAQSTIDQNPAVIGGNA